MFAEFLQNLNFGDFFEKRGEDKSNLEEKIEKEKFENVLSFFLFSLLMLERDRKILFFEVLLGQRTHVNPERNPHLQRGTPLVSVEKKAAN